MTKQLAGRGEMRCLIKQHEKMNDSVSNMELTYIQLQGVSLCVALMHTYLSMWCGQSHFLTTVAAVALVF